MIRALEKWLFEEYGIEKYRPDLSRIRSALIELLPELKKIRTVIIAGTNGKGETTHRLSRLAKSSTFCTWTSPHILHLKERFTSEDGEIDEEKLNQLALTCHEKVQKEKFDLSYYEFLFFVFCHWVLERQPQFLFLEVGLGGTYDAVNVLDAECVLLTSISRDHQEILGNRYDLILKEKLGVVRESTMLFTFLGPKYLRELTNNHLKKVSIVHLQEVTQIEEFDFSKRNQLLAHVAWRFLCGETPQKIHTHPFKSFNFDPEGLAHRGEVIKFRGEWHFYGSHNPDGVRKLIHFLRSANYNLVSAPFDVVLVSFSKRNPQDIKQMLRMLKIARLGKLIVTCFNHPKAYPAKELELLVSQEGIDFATDADSLIKDVSNQKFLVLGSYYFLSHIRNILDGQRGSPI